MAYFGVLYIFERRRGPQTLRGPGKTSLPYLPSWRAWQSAKRVALMTQGTLVKFVGGID